MEWIAERIVQVFFLLITLYMASNNWHTYIREKRYEKDGWFCMMAAMAATIASLYIWFH